MEEKGAKEKKREEGIRSSVVGKEMGIRERAKTKNLHERNESFVKNDV